MSASARWRWPPSGQPAWPARAARCTVAPVRFICWPWPACCWRPCRWCCGQYVPVIAAFLGYLLVITTTSVWTSWRAVRDKRDWAAYTGPVYRALMWLNLASALAIAAVGVWLAQSMQVVIVAFSGIGVLSFAHMWRFSRRAPTDPRWWLGEHLRSMMGNGVATHIAFLSIGLPKLLPMLAGPALQNLAWLGPLVTSFVAGRYLARKYLPARAARTAGPVAQTSPSLAQG